eukprot:3633123-Pyramimonas_sp.AAC.1
MASGARAPHLGLCPSRRLNWEFALGAPSNNRAGELYAPPPSKTVSGNGVRSIVVRSLRSLGFLAVPGSSWVSRGAPRGLVDISYTPTHLAKKRLHDKTIRLLVLPSYRFPTLSSSYYPWTSHRCLNWGGPADSFPDQYRGRGGPADLTLRMSQAKRCF